MSVYGTPKFQWKWEHDELIRQHDSNVLVQRIIEAEPDWVNDPVPTTNQIKSRRVTLKNLARLNEFRVKNGEPALARPHLPATFEETNVHLLGTLPDAMLADKLGIPAQTVRATRLERRIPSYKDTRHSSYDPEMEEDMLKTVKAIKKWVVDFTPKSAEEILHKIDPVWIKQCLDRLEREQNVGTTEV